MRVGTRAKIFAGVALLGGCSFFVDTSGLSDGSGSGDSSVDGAGGDGSASGDSATNDDATTSGDGGIGSIPDLAIYFPFDEGSGTTVTDKGPGAFVGNLYGSAAFTVGHSGSAVSFSGDGGNAGNVIVTDEPGLSIGSPATIAFWIDADDLPNTDERLVQMGYAWDVKLNGSGERPQLTWSEDDGGGGLISPVNGLPTGEWHHVAYTFDSTAGAAVYVDGRLQDNGNYQFATGQIFQKDTSGLTIGSATGSTDTCKCRIDELRLYSRALTAAEIKVIAQ